MAVTPHRGNTPTGRRRLRGKWKSGRRDSNSRPPGAKPGALGQTTLRPVVSQCRRRQLAGQRRREGGSAPRPLVVAADLPVCPPGQELGASATEDKAMERG